MKQRLKTLLLVLLLAIAPFALIGCDKKEGPMEELGEEIDEAVDEVQDEIDDATDGS